MLDESTLHDAPAKAPYVHRIIAKSIDFGIATLLIQIDSSIATVLGVGYWLIGDGFGWGQSVGKRLLRLRTIHPETYEPCSLQGSALRNGHLVLPLIFLQFGLFFQIVGLLIGGFAFAYEIQMLVRDDYGVRLGDILAETEVIRMDAPSDERAYAAPDEMPNSISLARSERSGSDEPDVV